MNAVAQQRQNIRNYLCGLTRKECFQVLAGRTDKAGKDAIKEWIAECDKEGEWDCPLVKICNQINDSTNDNFRVEPIEGSIEEWDETFTLLNGEIKITTGWDFEIEERLQQIAHENGVWLDG